MIKKLLILLSLNLTSNSMEIDESKDLSGIYKKYFEANREDENNEESDWENDSRSSSESESNKRLDVETIKNIRKCKKIIKFKKKDYKKLNISKNYIKNYKKLKDHKNYSYLVHGKKAFLAFYGNMERIAGKRRYINFVKKKFYY